MLTQNQEEGDEPGVNRMVTGDLEDNKDDKFGDDAEANKKLSRGSASGEKKKKVIGEGPGGS